MTAPLRKITSAFDKVIAIARRINNDTKGLGYWAAIDAFKKCDRFERGTILREIKDKTMKKFLELLPVPNKGV